MFRCISLVAFALIPTFMGCRGRSFLPPAGPILQQQSQAIINDPYPQADIAPSDPSARPPGYANPLPEATRNRLYRDSAYGFGR
ncbi:MAG: membrane or secreted protein [Planctomycetota bacterium]